MLGNYQLYGEGDVDLGTRAFYFTVADGLHDLGELVEGGLDASGWQYLANAGRFDSTRMIVGDGLLTSQASGKARYVLIPIPEPSVHAMYLAALVLANLSRRIRV